MCSSQVSAFSLNTQPHAYRAKAEQCAVNKTGTQNLVRAGLYSETNQGAMTLGTIQFAVSEPDIEEPRALT